MIGRAAHPATFPPYGLGRGVAVSLSLVLWHAALPGLAVRGSNTAGDKAAYDRDRAAGEQDGGHAAGLPGESLDERPPETGEVDVVEEPSLGLGVDDHDARCSMCFRSSTRAGSRYHAANLVVRAELYPCDYRFGQLPR